MSLHIQLMWFAGETTAVAVTSKETWRKAGVSNIVSINTREAIIANLAGLTQGENGTTTFECNSIDDDVLDADRRNMEKAAKTFVS